MVQQWFALVLPFLVKELKFIKDALKKEKTRIDNIKAAGQEGALTDELSNLERSIYQGLSVLDELLRKHLPEGEFDSMINQGRLTNEKKLKKLEETLDKKLLQNDLIDIHNTVYKNKKVQDFLELFY